MYKKIMAKMQNTPISVADHTWLVVTAFTLTVIAAFVYAEYTAEKAMGIIGIADELAMGQDVKIVFMLNFVVAMLMQLYYIILANAITKVRYMRDDIEPYDYGLICLCLATIGLFLIMCVIFLLTLIIC